MRIWKPSESESKHATSIFFYPTFLILKKLKDAYKITLLSVCPHNPIARQGLRKHVHVVTNTCATIKVLGVVSLCGPCRVKYSVCSERKVGDWFFLGLILFLLS
jgi:hypothetical protein